MGDHSETRAGTARGDGRRAAGAGRRIGYRAGWLERYEYGLDVDDAGLKAREAQHTEDVLRRRRLWGRIGSYLDIGTCTGRYLVLLRAAVMADGRIVGIDDNPECVRFARRNVERFSPSDARIEVLARDFAARDLELPGGPFQLVTCMMSTVSHFGRGRNGTRRDVLQSVLDRMAALLDDDGLLILSCWSRRAVEERRFLAIYDPEDAGRLARWTPSAGDLDRRLELAGFGRRRRRTLDGRLDFWTCRREAPRAGA